MRSILRHFLHSYANASGRTKDLAQVRLTSAGEGPKAGKRDLSAAVPAAATVINVHAAVARIMSMIVLWHGCSLPRNPVEQEVIWDNQSAKGLQRKNVSASLSYRCHPRAANVPLSPAAVDS